MPKLPVTKLAAVPAPIEPPALAPTPDPADAPPTDEPPVEEPAPEPEPTPTGEGVHHSLMGIILNSLAPDAEPAPVEPAPEPVIEEPAPAPAPAVEPPAPAAEPPKVRARMASVARGHVIDLPPPPAPELPVVAPPPPASSHLTAEQREEMEEAEVAARLFPERYKNYPEQLRKWYGEFEDRARALIQSNPNVTEESEDYQKLLQTKPGLKASDYKKVLKTVATEEAVAETDKRITPKLDRMEQASRRAEILPKVTSFSQQAFPKGILKLITDDPKSPLHETAKLFNEKGPAAALAEHRLEFSIADEVIASHKNMVHEFLLLKDNAVSFDQENNVHREINQLIASEGNGFAKNGGKYLVKDGRQFLPRAEFIAMLEKNPAEKGSFDRSKWTTGRYWSFTNVEIVDIMAQRAKNVAEKRITDELKIAEERGFQRAPKKLVEGQQPVPAKPPQEIHPPRARAAAAPGPSAPPKTPPVADNSPIPVSSIVAHLKPKR